MTGVPITAAIPGFSGINGIYYSDTFANLPISGTGGILYIVTADETHGGIATEYLWDGISYVYQGSAGTIKSGSPYRKDAVSTLASLPSSGNTTGEKRLVLDTGITYRRTGSAWIQDGYTLPGGLSNPLGNWNATTNTPTIVSSTGTNGDRYNVSVAGTIDIDGISSWAVGDYIWFDGSVWQKIDNQTPVNYQDQIDDLYGFAVAMGAAL